MKTMLSLFCTNSISLVSVAVNVRGVPSVLLLVKVFFFYVCRYSLSLEDTWGYFTVITERRRLASMILVSCLQFSFS